MEKCIWVALLLAITSCGGAELHDDGSLTRHPSFASTTTAGHSVPSPTTQVATATSTSAALEVLTGPAPLSPDGQLEQVTLPDGVVASPNGLSGQIRATAFGPQGDFGWGLSYYTALWGFFPGLPPHGLLTASGTWLIPDNWRYPETLCPEKTTARDSLTERGLSLIHI